MKTALPGPIESLFHRHPDLFGFSVRGRDEVPDNYPRDPEESGLFVGDIGIAPTLGPEHFAEIFGEIVAVLAELLAEAPEAGDALRGRTFARVLH